MILIRWLFTGKHGTSFVRALPPARRDTFMALIWMSPAIILVVLCTIYPLIFSVDYSLYKTTGFIKKEFIGLNNYIMLFKDPRFLNSIKVSLIFTFGSLILSYVLGFFITVMLRKKSVLNSVCRTVLLIPWITNEVVVSLLWQWILNPQMSPLYYISKQAGINLPLFLNDQTLALWSIVVINALRSLGFTLVMLMAGFSAIPESVEEAASIDGCGKLRNIWYIILPLVKPVTLVMIIVMTISNFNIVTLILTLTGGGPVYATETMPIRLYTEAFTFLKIATSSAMTTLMLIINLGFAAIYKKVISADGYYY